MHIVHGRRDELSTGAVCVGQVQLAKIVERQVDGAGAGSAGVNPPFRPQQG